MSRLILKYRLDMLEKIDWKGLWTAFIFLWKIARKSDILSQVRELCKMVEGMI